MKIALFGAAGFIGRNFVDEMKKKGLDFVASDIIDSPFNSDVEYKKANITDPEQVKAVVNGCDYIIHLAAHPLPMSIENPILNAKINILGTLNIMEAAKEAGVKKIVFSSASSIVGDLQYNPVDEKHPCVPKTPYAVCKYSIEHYLRVYKEIYDLDYLVFRFFNVYGPYQYPQSKALVPMVIGRILKGDEVFIFGNGSSSRDFIYVGDVVSFFLDSLESDVKNEVFNMGTGASTSIAEVIKTIGEVTGKEPNIVKKEARSGEIANFCADTTKLKKFFGKIPETSFRDGLEKTCNWFKEAGI